MPEFDQRLARVGYTQAFSWLAKELDSSATSRTVRPLVVAGLLACAGEQDKAMKWLQRGYETREWSMGWIATSPDLESLRGRTDFRELVRRVGLPQPEG